MRAVPLSPAEGIVPEQRPSVPVTQKLSQSGVVLLAPAAPLPSEWSGSLGPAISASISVAVDTGFPNTSETLHVNVCCEAARGVAGPVAVSGEQSRRTASPGVQVLVAVAEGSEGSWTELSLRSAKAVMVSVPVRLPVYVN